MSIKPKKEHETVGEKNRKKERKKKNLTPKVYHQAPHEENVVIMAASQIYSGLLPFGTFQRLMNVKLWKYAGTSYSKEKVP